ncbi:MAG TPA: pitrilysin family protein [Allosphingosinicella sp.]|uniref:M16 family metallopeptidase n=1 Tax=Allosphingosinicella sp. TaxID=2823234 RepID=UPI002EDB4A9C
MIRTLAFALLLAFAAPARAQQALPEAVGSAWGFDRSDLTPHPGVRFGVLPNGMRYALMRNGSPAGALSVRLHIDAGSSVEGAKEQGFMHMLEHLIFHGSANLPEGSLPLMLKHQGLRRWTDFNAYTSFDETVYLLDLSRSDTRARETALTLMHEIAVNLRFDRKAVEGAKKMIRDEIRARDAVNDRLTEAQQRFFLPGTSLAGGSVAGMEKSIARASGETLQRLYAHHYVPERATLVMVGDFDPNTAEEEIWARFSGWSARADAADHRPMPVSLPRRSGIEARLFVDPAAPTAVTIAAVEPLPGGADAGRRRDRQFLELMASEMLNRRLARRAADPKATLVKAESMIYNPFPNVRLARVEVKAADRDWRGALEAGSDELRRALEQGFSQAELNEQLIAMRPKERGLVQRTPALADAIVDAVERRLVFTEPADPAATVAYLAQIKLEDVNAAFRAAWAVPGRLIFVSHNRRIPNAAAAVAAAFSNGAGDRAF